MEKHTTHAIIHSEKDFFIKKKKETKKEKSHKNHQIEIPIQNTIQAVTK